MSEYVWCSYGRTQIKTAGSVIDKKTTTLTEILAVLCRLYPLLPCRQQQPQMVGVPIFVPMMCYPGQHPTPHQSPYVTEDRSRAPFGSRYSSAAPYVGCSHRKEAPQERPQVPRGLYKAADATKLIACTFSTTPPLHFLWTALILPRPQLRCQHCQKTAQVPTSRFTTTEKPKREPYQGNSQQPRKT